MILRRALHVAQIKNMTHWKSLISGNRDNHDTALILYELYEHITCHRFISLFWWPVLIMSTFIIHNDSRDLVGHFEWRHLAKSCASNSLYINEYICRIVVKNCACWWPSTIMCMRSMQWWPNSGPVDKEVAYAISFEISSRATQIMAIMVDIKNTVKPLI